jgi:hypothetical protein
VFQYIHFATGCLVFLRIRTIEFDKEELRSYIKIRVVLGVSPTDIHSELQRLKSTDAPAYSTVKKWTKRFSEGKQALKMIHAMVDQSVLPLVTTKRLLRR